MLESQATATCGVCGLGFQLPTRCYACRTGSGAKRKRARYRDYVREHCEACGFVAEHRCQLDVHHRDGVSTNDEPANLITLCANCHRLVTHAPAHWRQGGSTPVEGLEWR